MQRWEINASVPSVAGIYEIYYLESARFPRILKVRKAWYGGLRNEIRAESDPTLPQNAQFRDVLASGECYYRYTVCERSKDLTDVYSVLVTHRNVAQPGSPTSGRYAEVRIKEPEKMEIRRARRPHQPNRQDTHMGNKVPNMFDVVREMEKQEEIESRRRAIAPPEHPGEGETDSHGTNGDNANDGPDSTSQ